MHGLPNIDLAAAVTGKVGGFQQTGRDTRREQFPIPRPVIFVRDQAGILALQNPADALLHGLISQPVAARRHGVPLFPAAFIGIWIPFACADTFDQLARDTIALDRQRMVRICDISVVDALHVCPDISRQTRRFREAGNDRLPHLLPQQPYPVHIGRGFAGRDDQRRLVREGIVFTHIVPGSRHRLHDIVRYAVTPGLRSFRYVILCFIDEPICYHISDTPA